MTSGDAVAGVEDTTGDAVAPVGTTVGPGVVLGAGVPVIAAMGVASGEDDCCSGSGDVESGVADGVAAGTTGLAAGTVLGENKGMEGDAYGEATCGSKSN